MIDMEIDKVLAQMRGLQAAIERPPEPASAQTNQFSEVLRTAIESVNDRSMTAGKMMTDFETGQSDASVAEVMVAMQKASVSFQAMTEVRNKLIDAYHEIMNMPI